MYVCTSEIVKKANKIVDLCGTRDPHRIAKELGVEILYYPFNRQRGAYKVIMRNRFMFIKDNLHPVMEKIVLLHELGHDSLHRDEATQIGGFKEFNIFDMRDNRMEFEANVFASQIRTLSAQVRDLRQVFPYAERTAAEILFLRNCSGVVPGQEDYLPKICRRSEQKRKSGK